MTTFRLPGEPYSQVHEFRAECSSTKRTNLTLPGLFSFRPLLCTRRSSTVVIHFTSSLDEPENDCNNLHSRHYRDIVVRKQAKDPSRSVTGVPIDNVIDHICSSTRHRSVMWNAML
jgi:hypothetical protein